MIKQQERNYSLLVDTIKLIKDYKENISSEELLKELSKRGWKLFHYKKIFFDVQDMKNFFKI